VIAYSFGKWAAGRRVPANLAVAENANVAAVDQVDALAWPREPVAVYVWGDHSELYWRIDRPLVSYSIPQVLPAKMLDEWADAVLKQPRVIVVVDRAFFDHPAGDGAFARLQSLLKHRRALRLGPPGNEVSIYELRRNSSKGGRKR
jgi:hypothetical protein